MRALARTAVLLALASCCVAGHAAAPEAIPALEIVRPDQSVAATLRLVPRDHAAPATHWIVTISDGRRVSMALRELPALQVRRHEMHLQDRRVTRLQLVHCESAKHLEQCTPVDATISMLAAIQDDPGVGGQGVVLRSSELGVTSHVGNAIAHLLVEGGTVRMSTGPAPQGRRCRPERDVEC